MPFSGFLVTTGEMNLRLVVVIGSLKSRRSWLAWWIGYKETVGGKIWKIYLLSHHDLDSADKYFKYGQSTVLFTRLLPVIRTFIYHGIAK